MHVTVDRTRCVGHALCAAAAPDVFELDDDGYCATEHVEVSPDLEPQAQEGVLSCPEQAITIED